MTLPWDGSNLGSFSKEIIKLKQWIGKTEYWLITINKKDYYVLARITKDSFPCISDELKSVFGLHKLGTHLISISTKLYFLSKPPVREGILLEEISLKDFPVEYQTELFKKQVQEAFAFRELMGFTQSFEDNIHIRQSIAGFFYPISFKETSTSLEKEKKSLPNTILEKWFLKDTLKSVCCRLLGINNANSYEQITLTLGTYRDKIEKVINRIDKEYIWCSVYIIDRLTNVLI